jgi:predicted secreted hydrolase
MFVFSCPVFPHISTYKQRAQIHKHGGTVLPKFDPATATHIVTETNEKNTLRALGLKTLSEIPLEVPTVYWNWVISGKPIPGEKDKQQMDYEFMHAAFPTRVDAGRPLVGKGKGKQKLAVSTGQASVLHPGETSCVVVTVSHSVSSNQLYAHCFPGALAHEQLLPTLHHADHLAESTKRSHGWTSRHLRCAEEGTDWFAYSMPSALLLVTI